MGTATESIAELLQPFCGEPGGKYEYGRPWFADGYTYASDAKIVVRAPGVHAAPLDKAPPAPALSYWKQFPLKAPQPVPAALPVPPPTEGPCKECKGSGRWYECPECDGGGTVSWYGEYSRASYEDECQFCDGDGNVSPAKYGKAIGLPPEGLGKPCENCAGSGKVVIPSLTVPMSVGDASFDAKYVAVIGTLPEVRCQVGKSVLLFEAGEIQGALVGLV